jgi:signal transduction histidine kinase
MASCDLRDVVDEALKPIRDRLESDGFEVQVQVDENVPAIDADRTALVTAVSNLIENSAIFSEADRLIQIRAMRTNDQVCLSVEDHGIGMSKRDARRVFGRFYQVDTRLARTSGGVGLGLSIVKGVADGHGGTCHVNSVLGEGSTFELCLPISNSRGARA